MKTAQLIYSIICDDVRIEMGNKLSLMGLFENVFFPAFPSTLLKFAIVNHWIGVGQFETHVKVLVTGPEGTRRIRAFEIFDRNQWLCRQCDVLYECQL